MGFEDVSTRFSLSRFAVKGLGLQGLRGLKFRVHAILRLRSTRFGVQSSHSLGFRGLGRQSLAGKLMHTGVWGVLGVYRVVRPVEYLKYFEGTSPDTDRPMEKVTWGIDEQTLMRRNGKRLLLWVQIGGLCMQIPLNLLYRRCPRITARMPPHDEGLLSSAGTMKDF